MDSTNRLKFNGSFTCSLASGTLNNEEVNIPITTGQTIASYIINHLNGSPDIDDINLYGDGYEDDLDYDMSDCPFLSATNRVEACDFILYLLEQDEFSEENIKKHLTDVKLDLVGCVGENNVEYNFKAKIDIDLLPIYDRYLKQLEVEQLAHEQEIAER